MIKRMVFLISLLIALLSQVAADNSISNIIELPTFLNKTVKEIKEALGEPGKIQNIEGTGILIYDNIFFLMDNAFYKTREENRNYDYSCIKIVVFKAKEQYKIEMNLVKNNGLYIGKTEIEDSKELAIIDAGQYDVYKFKNSNYYFEINDTKILIEPET